MLLRQKKHPALLLPGILVHSSFNLVTYYFAIFFVTLKDFFGFDSEFLVSISTVFGYNSLACHRIRGGMSHLISLFLFLSHTRWCLARG